MAQLVRLVDLLDEAVARCKATIKTRREERNEPISDEVGGRGHTFRLCVGIKGFARCRTLLVVMSCNSRWPCVKIR